jgi:Spy/CpxP family protein refolding chaperone
MKRIKFLTAIALMIGFTAIAGNALAQRGQGRGMMNNPDKSPRMEQCVLNLTPEQDAQIAELRTNHLKEVTPLRNELGEKRARLRTLQSTDKPDLNAINKTIDEMGAIRTNIQKKGAAHRAEVSSLLTDVQRVNFNARKTGRMGQRGQGAMGRGMGNGMGRGMGNCQYSK